MPHWGGYPMLLVDTTNLDVRWNETIAPEVAGSTFSYRGSEQSDAADIGWDANVVFQAIGVPDYQFTYSTDKSWSKTFLSEADWEWYLMEWECWAKRCPSFVHINAQNFTLWTDANETFGNRVNGTYIYKIDIIKKDTGSIQRKTVTLNLKYAAPLATSSININLPFDLWIMRNQHNLPYYLYAPPPGRVSLSSVEKSITEFITEDELATLQEDFGQEVIDEFASWTKKDFDLAFQEARERLKKKEPKPIAVKPKFDS